MAVKTVREATFDVWREYGLTSIFANPGSTEIKLLTDLPDDLRFVLALHESSVVGMATGWAIGRGEPALAILHTTAGLGNAVGALATARVNRAPLVVLVGQQDRRHLATEPFLAGKLRGLAGEYPVWVDQPVRPAGRARRDRTGVPRGRDRERAGARDRADGRLGRRGRRAATSAPRRAGSCAPAAPTARSSAELAELLGGASSPALVVGAGADDPETWKALVALAERLGCPVWQESFSARAGFPQDHPLFAGHLPADRIRLRETLAPHDVVLAVGAPVFRQYPFDPRAVRRVRERVVAMVSSDRAEVHRSPRRPRACWRRPAAVCAELARVVPARDGRASRRASAPARAGSARGGRAAARRRTCSPPWPSASRATRS